MSDAASLPPPDLPGLDPAWSRLVRVADADGVERGWHLLDNGVDPTNGTLLCVHGNPTWSYLWRRLLAAAPPGWRVLAPDQLGMGYSERLSASRTLSQRVRDLGLLTEALDVRGPVVTIAHDWGGPVSLGWASEHRDELRGLVLTNTAVHNPPGTPAPAMLAPVRWSPLRALSCVRTPAFVRAATGLSRPPLPRDVRGAFAAPYATATRRRAVGDFVADIPFETSHPSRPMLDRIAASTGSLAVPALLLWGPRDPVFGQCHLDDLRRRLPHAGLHRYERASHLVTEDAPEYAEAVGCWLADLDAPAQPPPRTAGSAGPSTLGQRLAARGGDHSPAVVEVGRAAVSWSMLSRRVAEVGAGLAAVGVRPGQRVALLVPPSAELTAAVYAVWGAGAVVVLADKGLGLRGMGRALRGAGIDHVVATGAGLLAARTMRLPGARIAAGRVSGPLRRALGAEHTLADLARLGRDARHPVGAAMGDECALVFTSGATGPAKGVVYRHRQVQAQLDLVRSTYDLGGDDRIVAAFAPFSLYGPALGIGSAVPDMDVTAPGTLTAGALADAVESISATVVFASPEALRGVLSTATTLSARQRTALGGVRLLMSAGAPVSAPMLRSLRAVLPAAEAHTPYGMTEALPLTDISLAGIEAATVEAARASNGVCVGHPLPGVDLVVSPLSNTGAADGPLTTRPGVTGEVSVRAAHVKDSYDGLWATQRASARDPGRHRTGDVGHLDAQGRLWIEGRLEHVVTTADGVVTPVGIEQRVEKLDAVRSAAAVGVGPVGTQQIVVVVVPDGRPRLWSSPVAPPRLADPARAAAGVPVAAVLVVRTLPVDIRHASKIDRRAVAAWADRVLAGRG